MADNESVDIMESVFGNIMLPGVQALGFEPSAQVERRDPHHSRHSSQAPDNASSGLQALGFGQQVERRDSHHSRQSSQAPDNVSLGVQALGFGQQVERRDSQRSQQSSQAPVPKQRHDIGHHNGVPVLERERELHASFLGSEECEHLPELRNSIGRQSSVASRQSQHRGSLKSASARSKNSRHESIINRKLEPLYDVVPIEHHEEIVVEPQQLNNLQQVESDRISVSSGKLPKRSANTDQLIAELRSRHHIDVDYDNGTLSTSKTSELANEYELYSTPVPASEGTEMNEQTDDSGTETEEVLPVTRTKYLFDTKEPYHVEHDKNPDTFQQELGQKIAQRETPSALQHLDASNTIRSNASVRTADEFIVSIFENKTQERVRTDIGQEVKLDNLRQMFESPPPDQNNNLPESHKFIENKHSYKQFLGRKSPEHKILRSGSIVSTNVFPIYEPKSNDYEPLPTVNEYGKSQQFFHEYRHSYTGEKPNVVMVNTVNVEGQKPVQLNGHARVHPYHRNAEHVHQPPPRRSNVFENVNSINHSHQNAHESESRRSTVIEKVDLVNQHPHHEHNHQESRRSTVVNENSEKHYDHEQAKVPQKSWRSFVTEKEPHHHHQKFVETPYESRRSTVIEKVELTPAVHQHRHNENCYHYDKPESRRSTLHEYNDAKSWRSFVNEHQHHDHPESRRSTLHEHQHHEHQHHEHPESRRSTLHEHSNEHHYHEINNNSETLDHTPVSKLCTIFEENYQAHPKNKHFIIAPASPIHGHQQVESFQDLEKYHIPLFSRVVITDDIAHGTGSCTPGSISALHKSVLLGNSNIRPITPISYAESIGRSEEREKEGSTTKGERPIVVEAKKRRSVPKSLAAFYDQYGKMSTVSSEI